MPEGIPDTNPARISFASYTNSIIPYHWFLIVEAVAKFYIDFARIVPVESAEGYAVVEFYAAIGHVHGIQWGGKALAEIFPEGKIEGRVRRQISAGIGLIGEGIGESGAVVNVRRRVGVPRKRDLSA